MGKLKVEGGPLVVSTSTKVASLSFTTPEELQVYEAFAEAAKADDRSVPAFLVRFLCGKEEKPFIAAGTQDASSANAAATTSNA